MMIEFDTLSYSKQLQRTGLSEEQAEALAGLRLEIERLKAEVNDLKVGRPVRQEAFDALERKLLPLEVWPATLFLVVTLSAVVTLVLIALTK